MHETAEDVEALQSLLDASYAGAGRHLASIHTPENRLNARQLVATLVGVQVLDLATVTGDCRPLVGPVDGLFYRGRFVFGSSPDSVRFRHIRRRPHVSAAHTRGEDLGITVHGRAVEVSLRDRGDLRDLMLEVYGPQWTDWGHDDAPYAYIDADRMYAFSLQARGYPEAPVPPRQPEA